MTPRRKDLFSKSKLIFCKLSKRPQVFWDKNGVFASANTNMVYNLHTYDYRFLLGYLNSQLFNFVYHTMYGGLSMLGTIQVQAPQIKKSLIPTVTNSTIISLIIDSVDNILLLKENPLTDTSIMENEVDKLVYKLYDLTYDEVLIVDPETPITREEYEKTE